jgi:sulfotransferase family protein
LNKCKKRRYLSNSKCIILLSEKSSGSSACQNLLSRFTEINTVKTTRHFRNETLYWTKAASILRRPQLKMIDSEVPIKYEKAKQDLQTLLSTNIEGYIPPKNERELIFKGWEELCKKFRPIFLEKSPHHLYQWSALELILECINEMKKTDFILIGLIRNPLDTIYSQFSRWRSRPEELQNQWYVAYNNLLKLKKISNERLVIIRYEDMVTSLNALKTVFEFCDIKVKDADQNYLHQKSILKWKKDSNFGFELSEPVRELAKMYGYKSEDLTNRKYATWPIYRETTRMFYHCIKTYRKILRALQ